MYSFLRRERLRLAGDLLQCQGRQGVHGLDERGLGIGGRGGQELGAPPRLRDLGGGQLDRAIGLHAQQRDPAGHVLEFAVGFSPVEHLADGARERAALEAWGMGDQTLDHYDILGAEVPSAIDRHEISTPAGWLTAGTPQAGTRIALSRAASMVQGLPVWGWSAEPLASGCDAATLVANR